jgi:hypothetical protein
MFNIWLSLFINFVLLFISIWFWLDPGYFRAAEFYSGGIVWVVFNIPYFRVLVPVISFWGVLFNFRKL